jgi:hypothetical protein
MFRECFALATPVHAGAELESRSMQNAETFVQFARPPRLGLT